MKEKTEKTPCKENYISNETVALYPNIPQWPAKPVTEGEKVFCIS